MALKKNARNASKMTKNSTEIQKEEKVEEVVQEKPKRAPRAKRVEVDPSREVLVINMTQGSLLYSARKGNGYLELDSYLDSDYMAISDLQIMKNSNRGIFEKGWLFVDDEEAVEYLKLEKYMAGILLPDELEDLFEMHPQELQEEMKRFSSSMKENIYQALKIAYENGSISNVHVIRAIEESLDIDMSLSILNV